MRKQAIKGILFSLTGFVGISAQAGNLPEGLYLLSELPVSYRVAAHEQVLRFLNDHPEAAAATKVIAMDERGRIYVLDEKLEKIVLAGSPTSGL